MSNLKEDLFMQVHNEAYDSVEGFSDRTTLSSRQVWKLLASGDLPSIRVGRRRLIPVRAALEALTKLGTEHARQRSAQM